MCTRFVLEGAAAKAGFARLGLEALADAVDAALERFNIPPGSRVPALREGARPGTARAFQARWGFGSRQAGGAESGSLLVNGRAETVAEKPSFREAYRRRRCLVPATGFYEWEKRGRARLPWLFRRADALPFCFAGLWEPAPGAGDGDDAALVIVTTTANAVMAPIHDRMPVLLTDAAACRAWLNTGDAAAVAAGLFAPPAEELFSATPVSPRMNRAEVDDADCVRPAVHGLAPRDDAPGPELF